MKKVWLIVLALCATLVLAACSVSVEPSDPNDPDDPGDGGTTPIQVEGNNAAVLTGDSLGSGTAASAELRKEVSVDLNSEVADLEVGDAYLARENAGTETFEWFVALTNTGEQTYCFVRAVDIQFSDDAGVLLEEDFNFVQGSIRVGANSDTYTDTCLADGQTGYFFGTVPARDRQLYSVIDRIDLADITVQTGFSVPQASIVPQEYALATSTTPPQLAVTVINEGAASAKVLPESNYLLLDDDGSPLTWNFFGSLSWDGFMAADESRVLNDALVYSGSSERLLVYVDFENPNSSIEALDLSALAGLSGAAAKERYIALRNAHEEQSLARWLESER